MEGDDGLPCDTEPKVGEIIWGVNFRDVVVESNESKHRRLKHQLKKLELKEAEIERDHDPVGRGHRGRSLYARSGRNRASRNTQQETRVPRPVLRLRLL